MDSTAASVRKSAEEKLDVDARESLKKAMEGARGTLASADGDYSGVVPQDQRDSLRKAINEAEDAVSKSVKHDDAKAKEDAVNAAKAAVDKTISDYEAQLAEQRRQAEAASAWSGSYGSGSYGGSSQASTAGWGGSGYSQNGYGQSGYSGNSGYSGSGRSGYYTATSCGSNVAECQRNIDGNGSGALNVMTTDVAGTKYYQAHTSSWGASSVNINGQNHALGAWQQAQYIDGKPYGPNDGKSYYQTCGPDGKVYYAPMY